MDRRRSPLGPVACATLGLLFGAQASAIPITYDIVATIDPPGDTFPSDPSLDLPSQLGTGGSAVIGFITVEDSTVDSDLTAARGAYLGAVTRYQLTVNGLVFDYDATIAGARSQVVIRDRINPGVDLVSFSATDGFAAYSTPAGSGFHFSLNIQSDPLFMTGDILSSDALAPVLADVSIVPAWFINWTVFNDLGDVASNVSATVSSFTRRAGEVPVSEPGTALLMTIALLGLGRRRAQSGKPT